jgi:hybrid cluster-associated redox disulfide protein
MEAKKMAEKVTKDTKIGELLMIDRKIAVLLMQAGMHCVGCPSSADETIDEASMVHGMDSGKLVDAINDYLEKQE